MRVIEKRNVDLSLFELKEGNSKINDKHQKTKEHHKKPRMTHHPLIIFLIAQPSVLEVKTFQRMCVEESDTNIKNNCANRSKYDRCKPWICHCFFLRPLLLLSFFDCPIVFFKKWSCFLLNSFTFFITKVTRSYASIF